MTETDVSQSLPIAPYESDSTAPSSPEAEGVDDVKPAGDASDVLIDMPQTYSGPLRPGEKSAEVPGRVETSEISEEPTSSILQWSNQDQIDHRDRIAEAGRLSKYLSHFPGVELLPNDGTQNLEREKEDVEASVRLHPKPRAAQIDYMDDALRGHTRALQSMREEREKERNVKFPPTENCAKNNIAMYGESNSKTMPTNSDLLAAINSMHLSLERLIMNNVGTFIPPVNGRPLTALNERNRNTTEELRQVDGVLPQEQRGKGRRGGRGKNNRRTPLHYDYDGDSHGSTHAHENPNDYARGGPSR